MEDFKPISARPGSLRILCIDGGGIKGYTSLITLQRVFRTISAEGTLKATPKPCDVFDLIVGTSTGGLIAIMLGRLHMTIDECIEKYEKVGEQVFGQPNSKTKLGRAMRMVLRSPFYDIEKLQNEVKKVLGEKSIESDAHFKELDDPKCKVMVCVTNIHTGKHDVLRNYESLHPSVANYSCNIWEAASATAAAPRFFKPVKFQHAGGKWCDGGLRRNNPINEAHGELQKESRWKEKNIGCILSLGTGVKDPKSIDSSLSGLIKTVVSIVTDSDDVARQFGASKEGAEYSRSKRYFRFSVPQGMSELKLDDWKATETMRALTNNYLADPENEAKIRFCAQSLLDPDQNLESDKKRDTSLVPYHTCTNFILRPQYAERLFEFFFSSKGQLPQKFVLWGMGGTGKTQIALRLAQDLRFRFRVFWVRADSFSNFAADYVRILRELGVSSASSTFTAGVVSVLEATRDELQQQPDQWLLILDNADDLDSFLGQGTGHDNEDNLSISRFLPTHGRILITSRDRRFQGFVTSANDGMRVDLMDAEEATNLLTKSIPPTLLQDSDASTHARTLIEELGYLPLAIAQAAANIVVEQLKLEEFVRFFLDKKQKMSLMQAPARDVHTTDSRNTSQSLSVTFQMSFNVLKERWPRSALLLTYIGFLHWRRIPKALLWTLPEFSNCSEAEFLQITRRPQHLCLLEEQEVQKGSIEYSVHSMVHENLNRDLHPSQITMFLENVVDVCKTFSPATKRWEPSWDLAMTMGPHIDRIVGLTETKTLSSQSLSILLRNHSGFLHSLHRFNDALALATRAKDMALVEFASQPDEILHFQIQLADTYEGVAKNEEAVKLAHEQIRWMDSDSVQSSMDEEHSIAFKMRLWALVVNSSNRRSELEALELLFRQAIPKTATGSRSYLFARFYLARVLKRLEKYEEAEKLAVESLQYKATLFKSEWVGVLSFLSDLAGAKRAAPWKIIETYQFALDKSLELIGVEDATTWTIVAGFVDQLTSMFRMPKCGKVFWQVLPAAISAGNIPREGHYKNVILRTTSTANRYLRYLDKMLEDADDKTEADDFRALYQQWQKASGCFECDLTQSSWHMEYLAGEAGLRGDYRESEECFKKLLDLCRQNNEPVDDSYYYHIVMAMQLQGRDEDANAFRDANLRQYLAGKAGEPTIEERIVRLLQLRSLHEMVGERMNRGELRRGDQFWNAYETQICFAEYRFGRLEPGKQFNRDGEHFRLPREKNGFKFKLSVPPFNISFPNTAQAEKEL